MVRQAHGASNSGAEMSRDLPVASVIIPARNAAASIPDQLLALASQLDAPPFEVIVVDNGSTDDTVEIATVEASRLGLSCTVVSAAEKVGPGFARNCGVALAAADRVVFCDADDRVGRTWVRGLVDALEGADLVGGPVSPGQRRLRTRNGAPFVLSSSMGIRRDTFLALGGFDESLVVAEDLDLCLRASLQGLRSGYAPDARIERGERPQVLSVWLQNYRYGLWGHVVTARYAENLGFDYARDIRSRAFWLVARVFYLALSRARRRMWVKQAGLLVGLVAGRRVARRRTNER
jgi:glycosyltransferase involved in cell wall biosynthesis